MVTFARDVWGVLAGAHRPTLFTVWAPDHEHWHLLGFDRYLLLRLGWRGGGPLIDILAECADRARCA
jgi:hypothetical protein